MLQQIADYFSKPKPIFAPVHNGNVLVITANIKQGTLTVSHKGKVRAAKFGDNTLRNMMNGVRFRKNTEVFVTAIDLTGVFDTSRSEREFHSRRTAGYGMEETQTGADRDVVAAD